MVETYTVGNFRQFAGFTVLRESLYLQNHSWKAFSQV